MPSTGLLDLGRFEVAPALRPYVLPNVDHFARSPLT